jgi:hypothetical protein
MADTKQIGRPFPAGVSGNPGGRPRGVSEIQALARSKAPRAIEILHEIAENGKSESARVAASVALLDRGWGKAAQVIAGDKDNPIQVNVEQQAQAVAMLFAKTVKQTPPLIESDDE